MSSMIEERTDLHNASQGTESLAAWLLKNERLADTIASLPRPQFEQVKALVSSLETQQSTELEQP